MFDQALHILLRQPTWREDIVRTAIDEIVADALAQAWAAGPLAKIKFLSRTGGNGYAFLKLHHRTGDAI